MGRRRAVGGDKLPTLDLDAPRAHAAGAFDAAARMSREAALWHPPLASADYEILDSKQTLDARTRDQARNDGYIGGAVQSYRDGIVGSQFSLIAKPNWRVLGQDEIWAREFADEVEARFDLFAESPSHWIDASRINTLTGLIRLGVGVYATGGEVLATAEWIKERQRPYYTAIQMIDADRLSNPFGRPDAQYLRGGVEKDTNGAPLAYHIRTQHPQDVSADVLARWKRVPVRKDWGRLQVIHIYEMERIDQSRGIAAMVSALKEMRMTKKFRDIVLQNAVVNATYAATITSELPDDVVYGAIGAGEGSDFVTKYLAQIAAYSGGAKNLMIDGVKIPHLYPGTKLDMLKAGTPGGVGTDFEDSLLRYIAASLGLSYEQFTKDFRKSSYAAFRAASGETQKFFLARRKMVADRMASAIYTLWLEEAIAAREITTVTRAMPRFRGLEKDAYASAIWIGAARGQVDELKETQAAVLRIAAGLSTFEIEIARIHGRDYREFFEQRARETALMKQLGVSVDLNSRAKGKGNSSEGEDDPNNDDDENLDDEEDGAPANGSAQPTEVKVRIETAQERRAAMVREVVAWDDNGIPLRVIEREALPGE